MPDVFNENQIHQKPESALSDRTGNVPSVKHTKHDVGVFSTFVRDPRGIAIAEQHVDEKILLFIRRDLVTNIPWVSLGLFFIIVPIFVPFFISPISFVLNYFSQTTLAVIVVFYYIIVAGYIFGNFVTWFYDIGIVTEERSIDIDFYNISYVSVATARSQDLKEVRYFQRGIFESLFDYGDVTVIVEASGEALTFERTPRPAEVVSILSALIGGHQKKQ